MKNKLIKVISSVLALIMIFGTVITNLSITETYAKENVIKNILVYKTTIQHGEYFRLDVEFGGAGTKVKKGQTERIDFNLSNVKLTLPENPIQLEDKNTGKVLGDVTFESNTVIMKFNQTAEGLNDIQGGFYFSVAAHYLGDIQQEGFGRISITSGSIRKDKELINRQGGLIQGTVPGELKIKKVIRGKTVPIKGVEFTLERKDKAEFEAKDGEEIKRGISIKLVTNADGVINVKDLRAGDYIL